MDSALSSEGSLLERFEAWVIKGDGCWEWNGPRYKNGRPAFKLAGIWMVAARLSYELYKGSVPKGKHVCHDCDNSNCVGPKCLKLGTRKQNMEDAANRGLLPWGEKNHFATMTNAQVIELRKLYADNVLSVKEIAERFGTNPHAVWRAATGITWRLLPGAVAPRSQGLPRERNPAVLNPERLRRGEKHGQAKVSDDDVLKIRALKLRGWKIVKIAAKFGISRNQTSRIALGKSRQLPAKS